MELLIFIVRLAVLISGPLFFIVLAYLLALLLLPFGVHVEGWT